MPKAIFLYLKLRKLLTNNFIYYNNQFNRNQYLQTEYIHFDVWILDPPIEWNSDIYSKDKQKGPHKYMSAWCRIFLNSCTPYTYWSGTSNSRAHTMFTHILLNLYHPFVRVVQTLHIRIRSSHTIAHDFASNK